MDDWSRMDELKSSVPVKQEINVFSLIFIEKQSYLRVIMKKFIFPGSFDPFTNGHKAIVDQAYNLCDEFIIALATNLKKGDGLIKRSERVGIIK